MPTLTGNKNLSIHFLPPRTRSLHLSTETDIKMINPASTSPVSLEQNIFIFGKLNTSYQNIGNNETEDELKNGKKVFVLFPS